MNYSVDHYRSHKLLRTFESERAKEREEEVERERIKQQE